MVALQKALRHAIVQVYLKILCVQGGYHQLYELRQGGRSKLMNTSQKMLCQQGCEMFSLGRFPISGHDGVDPLARGQLVIVNTSNQVLGGDDVRVFCDVDWPGNVQHMLDQYRSNSHYPLKSSGASLALIVLLAIAGHRWKIRVQVGIAQTPTSRRDIKPLVGRRERDDMTSGFKWSIQQVNIC